MANNYGINIPTQIYAQCIVACTPHLHCIRTLPSVHSLYPLSSLSSLLPLFSCSNLHRNLRFSLLLLPHHGLSSLGHYCPLYPSLSSFSCSPSLCYMLYTLPCLFYCPLSSVFPLILLLSLSCTHSAPQSVHNYLSLPSLSLLLPPISPSLPFSLIPLRTPPHFLHLLPLYLCLPVSRFVH